jgi:hypothetical protein
MVGKFSNCLPLLCTLAAVTGACGSSAGATLQGPEAFAPNATLAVQLELDGGLYPSFLGITAMDSDPADSCAYEAATGLPQAATLRHKLSILVTQPGPITAGTYGITDADTFFPTTDVPDGSVTLIQFFGPDDHFGSNEPTASSTSGTLQLTSAGASWAGNFTATMVDDDGGVSTLSGSFDTGSACVVSLITEY